MSLFPVKRGWKPVKGNGDSIKKKRGRPVGSGRSEDPTVRSIRVTEPVSLMLEDWKKEYHAETFDEAIRLFVKNHIKTRKKVDALLEERQQPALNPQTVNMKLVEVVNK